MAAGRTKKLHLLIALNEDDGWGRFRAEEVDAIWVKPGRAKLTNPPAFARGLASGDVVSVVERGEETWFNSLVERGDHSTIRLIGRHGHPVTDATAVIENHGVRVVGTALDGLLAVDIGPEVDYGAVHRALFADFGVRWEFQEAALSPRHAAQRP
jgi:hypothetical protein